MAYPQRLERDIDSGVREAFRVLHQGLSCLAGQISATDRHSAHVAAQLTSNWEEMARRLGEMRVDLDTSCRVLEARLSASEKSAHYNSSALDHALEKIEAFVRQRAMDQAESQRQTNRHEQLLERLSDAFLRLEKRMPEANLASRLEALEQAVRGPDERKEPDQPASPLLAALETLSQRLEGLEKDRASLLAELRAGTLNPAEEAPVAEPAPEHAGEEHAPDFEDIFAQAEPANFLGRARMSPAASDENRPRYHFAVAAGLVAVLALAAVAAQDWRAPNPVSVKPAAAAPTYAIPLPPDADATQFVIAPQPAVDQDGPAPQRLEPESGEGARLSPPPLKQHVSRNASLNTTPDGLKPSTADAAPPGDRVQQLAAQGNADALTLLGLEAADASNGSADRADAVKYLTEASAKGQPVAQYRLGSLYEHGLGVAADPIKAAHWYALAAAQGNRKAMHNLAVFYASRRQMAEAARWFAKAAALGLPDSQFNLAILYERGDGVPQSLAEAFKWYAIAAAGGDAESKARMTLLQGQLSEADKATASQAAAAFHPQAFDRRANLTPQSSELPPT